MQQNIAGAIGALLFLGVISTSYGQDAVSMASPSREPIWTARLFVIAVNDEEPDSAHAMFSPDARLVFDTTRVSAADRSEWLHDRITVGGVGIHVRENLVDDRRVTIRAEWGPDGDRIPVEMQFLSGENGLIDELTIRPLPEP
ncbi:MAG: hypothetical protein PF508_09895 [Spirochaeta sp.]|nr:hypothetical protein [Spirochaeta sp.]